MSENGTYLNFFFKSSIITAVLLQFSNQFSIYYYHHIDCKHIFSVHTSCTKMLRTSRETKTKYCPMAWNYIPNCVKTALGLGGRVGGQTKGSFGNLFSFARLKKQSILLLSPARKWCLYFGKIKLLTCAIVVIIRAITLFSFIHSGFARGCQLLQQQLA